MNAITINHKTLILTTDKILTDSTAVVKITSGTVETVTIITNVELVQVKEKFEQMALGTETDFQVFQNGIANKINQNQFRIKELKSTMNRMQEEIRIDYLKKVTALEQKNNNLRSKLAE